MEDHSQYQYFLIVLKMQDLAKVFEYKSIISVFE